MKNEMTEGMVYSEEMEQWVDIAEWLQHVRSVANTLIPGFQYDYRWTSCSSTDINGNTLTEGSLLGVFYPDLNGNIVCAGYEGITRILNSGTNGKSAPKSAGSKTSKEEEIDVPF